MSLKKKKFPIFLVFVSIILILSGLAATARAALVGNTNQATLNLTPATGSYAVGDTFKVAINVNTKGQSVVVVAAYLKFDPNVFEAQDIDATGSVFSIGAENTINQAGGTVKITRGQATPGINSASGLVALVTFKAKTLVSPTSDNITFDFTAGSTGDSNVILNDGKGTEFLSGVYGGSYVVKKIYGINDFISLVGDWMKNVQGSVADASGDGTVNAKDLGIMMSNWGS